MLNKYGPILSVEQETIVENVNLASNRDYNHGAIIKQLLDEVEHDIMNYQNRGLCYLPKPKVEADNTDTCGLDHAHSNGHCLSFSLPPCSLRVMGE